MDINIGTLIEWGTWLVVAVVVLTVFFSNVFTVEQQTVAVIERFGKFARIARAGLNLKVPFIERYAGELTLRLQKLDLTIETKTKDNVFVVVKMSIQYIVIPDKAFDAFYRLTEPAKQIGVYVFDVVRSKVPKLDLDEAFEKKDEIGNEVRQALGKEMAEYGFGITAALVVDIDPDAKVKSAMNDINAAQREQMAATSRGEGARILAVKNAEAEAQSKALQGQGIANQRKAIIEGLRESVLQFTEGVPGAKPEDVMVLVMMTQYFDTLKSIGESGKATTVLLPHAPGAFRDLMAQIRDAMIVAERV